jgi:hypothetical protein
VTRIEAQSIIEGRLGQRTGLGPRIQSELRLSQSYFEKRPFLSWFLVARPANTSISTATEVTQTGFLRELDDEPYVSLRIYEGGVWRIVPLQKETYFTLKKNTDLLSPAQPRFYCITDNSNSVYPLVNYYPPPNKSYVVEYAYYKAEPVLVADETENRWLIHAPELLISHAGLQVAKALRATEAAQLFALSLKEAVQDLNYNSVARGMAAMDISLGG